MRISSTAWYPLSVRFVNRELLMPERQTFRAAIAEEWRQSAGATAKSRVLKMLEVIGFAPLIYLAIASRWGQQTAMDYILRGLIAVIITGLGVVIFNSLWTLAMAPRRIFYRQQGAINELQRNLVAVEKAGGRSDARPTSGTSMDGEVAALLHPENYASMILGKSVELIVTMTKAGNWEGVTKLAKGDVNAAFPALAESFGKTEKNKYLTVIEEAKIKAGEDWPLLFRIANQHLSGVIETRRSKKLLAFLAEIKASAPAASLIRREA
jgi:hypothetical protein